MAVDDGTSLIHSGRAYASLYTRALLHILSLRHFDEEEVGATSPGPPDTVVGVAEGPLPVVLMQRHLSRLRVKPTFAELEQHLDPFGETSVASLSRDGKTAARDGRPRFKGSVL